MKILLTFVLILLSSLFAVRSQNLDIRYINAAGNTVNYVYSNINSDYGPRIVSNGSFYHPGIDLNLPGDEDFGLRILSPVSGTIRKLRRSTRNHFTYLTIDGTDNRNYGYGHLFDDAANPSGNFTLKKMGYPNEDEYCIIDHLDPNNIKAFGPVEGTVSYNNIDYLVETTVEIDQSIGPIGNSGPGGSHLHLYLLLNASGNLRPPNAKNPIQYLYTPIANPQINFEVDIAGYNKLTFYPSLGNFFSGSEYASIKTRILLPDEEDNDPTFDNSVMDIEKVGLYIKKFEEDDSKYALMKGDSYNLEINLGGGWNNTIYPSIIQSNTGNFTRTGIYPYAYNEDNPHNYDDFYFSNLLTRIHKDDNFLETRLAAINKEAYYKDGIYTIKPKVHRVSGAEVVNNEIININVDNFCPYVERVKVRENYQNSTWKYSRGWIWSNNNILTLEPGITTRVNGNFDAVINITMSEPLLNMGIQVGSYNTTLTTNILDKWIWEFTVPKENLIEGENIIKIWGEDLNHNEIQISPNIIPIRGNNDIWSPIKNGGQDTYHKFLFTKYPINFIWEQTGKGPLTISFKDDSDITGLSYSWHFGDIYDGSAYTKDTEYNYQKAGVYQVKHGVDNYDVLKNVAVHDLPLPNSDFDYSPIWNQGEKSPLTVDFYSNATGIIYSYLWDFDGCGTSTEKNPKGIIMEEKVPYNVSLTVKSGDYSDTYTSEIYIDRDRDPLVSIIPFQLSYFEYDLEVCTSNFSEDVEKTFYLDFGDGTHEEFSSYNSYYLFNHQYYNIGTYTLRATVSEEIDGNTIIATYIREIRIYPYDLEVTIYQDYNESPYPQLPFKFRAFINPSGDYYGYWYIYKKGDPTYYKSINFNSQINSNPELNYVFNEAGEYLVGISVSTNGLPSAGCNEITVDVVNAPDYIESSLSGPSTITTNTTGTFYASLFPVGDPGVPEANWWTTDLRWRLYKKNNDGTYTILQDIHRPPFEYLEAQFLHVETFNNFTSEGEYKLILEAWNNTHEYEVNELNPSLANTLSFYDFSEKIIQVSNSFPTLTLIDPNLTNPLPNDGSLCYPLKFTNYGTEPVDWEIIENNCDLCIVPNYIQTGVDLNNNEIVSCDLFPTANNDADTRYILITVKGTINGVDIEGSPSYFYIEQFGTNPPMEIINGDLAYHEFGSAVSVDDRVVVIGAPSTNVNERGVAYVYEKNNLAQWIRTSTLIPSDHNPAFGGSVDIYGENIIISGDNTEKTYIYKKLNGTWGPNEFKKITNIIDENQLHGVNVTIWGDYCAIGYPLWSDKGIVLVYGKNSGGIDNWGEVKRFFGNYQPDYKDHFGSSIDLYNDKLVVGACGEGWNGGYFNIYNRNKILADDWELVENRLPNPSDEPDIKFGQKVSIFDNAITTCLRNVTAWVSSIDVPLYMTDEIGNIIDQTYASVFSEIYLDWDITNIIQSMSLYKDLHYESGFDDYEHPEEKDIYNFLGYHGDYDFHSGRTGCTFFSESGWYEGFGYGFPLGNSYYPNFRIGASVSTSHFVQLTGIPGYNIDNAKGAVIFDNNFSVESKNQAGIKIHFINFTKPTGNYGTVEAKQIIIGGRNFPAIFESGVQIKYDAQEIIFDNGFFVNKGAEFIAQANIADSKSRNQVLKSKSEDSTLIFLKNLYDYYPQFPWQQFNPIDLLSLNKFVCDKKSNTTKPLNKLLITLPNFEKRLIFNKK